MKKTLIALTLIVLCALTSCSNVATDTLQYPKTRQIKQTDVYHGVRVSDPYQWLEEDCRQSSRVSEWIEAQNKVTFDYLHHLPQREAIKKRLTELWNYEKIDVPLKVGRRYFVSKNDGLQNHNVIYTMDTLDGPRRVLFNPNTWSEDGTTALSRMSFNRDGTLVAYAIQESGSDWKTWKIRDVKTGKDLPDTFTYLKAWQFAWTADSKGVYYTKFPDPEPGKEFLALNKDMKVMYHDLGTPQSEDRVVYYQPDHPEWGYYPIVSDDGRYLILLAYIGTDDKNRVIYKDLQSTDSKTIDLIDNFDSGYTFIDNKGPVFYFYTNNDAPNGRVIAIDIRNPEPDNWKEIIKEDSRPLKHVNMINDMLVCSYLKDATSQVSLFTLEGKHIRDVSLPGLGQLSGFEGKADDTETFYSHRSYTTPPTVYRYDMITGESELFEQPEIAIDFDLYTTEQVFFESKDGTRIPMFVAYKKGLRRDGDNPTILYGYGGFSIPLLPYFSISQMVWMEMGGVLATANLRGGGEYGEAWHEAGKKMHKQNVFDDFIAAAEYLIDEKYTSSKKLAIRGGSNGGLLVGACMTQRPELFAAAVPSVGVMDMLRFDQFTAGRYWTDEFGSAKDSREMFAYLKGYSPYHNIKAGTRYPTTLVMTADTDDRVVPGHSFKFIAKLQQAHAGKNPVLIRVQTKAGHGSGKPTSMRIETASDTYAFLAENLGME